MSGRKLKVLILCQSLHTGGLEHMVVGLASHLNRDLIEGAIGCLGQEGDLADLARSSGIPVHALGKGPGIRPGFVLKLRRLLRREKIDVLHTHNAGCLVYGAPAAKLAGTAVLVHTEHGRLMDELDNPRLHRVERHLSRWADALVAVSEPTRARYAVLTGIARERIQTIENGIEVQRFQRPADPRLREALGIRAEDHVVGVIARISEEKDHANLLRAMARVMEGAKNFKVLIVGDGPERAAVEALARQLRLDHKVVFTGRRDDVPVLLALVDVFVLPSKTEGMPLTLLEAMAAGKAVVCTAVGGMPDIIRDGKNGLLVPPEHEARLGEAILSLIRDRSLSDRLREAARKDAEQKYSIEHMVQAYEALYRECWEAKQGGS